MYLRQILISWLIAHRVSGAVRVELGNGEVITINDEMSITPTVDSHPGDPIGGGIAPRDLFGRQYCSDPGQNIICGNGCCPSNNYCCDNASCIDTTSRICCNNGWQCDKGGDCCLDGNCCDPGNYCVRDLDTGRVGCLPYSKYSTSSQASLPTTSIRTASPTSSFTCNDAGYSPCPDNRFCCPSGDYCYYNIQNGPRCNRDIYYTLYYSFSWSFSYGIRWFTTTTTYYLDAPSVFAISTPPIPTTPPPQTSATVEVPSPAPLTPTPAGATSTSSDPAGAALPGGAVEDSQTTARATSQGRSSSRTSSGTTAAGISATPAGGAAASKAGKLLMTLWNACAWTAVIGGVFFVT